MRVLITGGAGFIGKKLATRLLERGRLLGRDIDRLVLFDVAADADGLAPEPRLDIRSGNIGAQAAVEQLIEDGFDAVYHLAAVVSAAAEADFDLGMSVTSTGRATSSRRCDSAAPGRASSSPAPARYSAASCRRSSPTRGT